MWRGRSIRSWSLPPLLCDGSSIRVRRVLRLKFLPVYSFPTPLLLPFFRPPGSLLQQVLLPILPPPGLPHMPVSLSLPVHRQRGSHLLQFLLQVHSGPVLLPSLVPLPLPAGLFPLPPVPVLPLPVLPALPPVFPFPAVQQFLQMSLLLSVLRLFLRVHPQSPR